VKISVKNNASIGALENKNFTDAPVCSRAVSQPDAAVGVSTVIKETGIALNVSNTLNSHHKDTSISCTE
jgi:hypothetical protein